MNRREIFLFPFTVKRVISTLSQSQGWGIRQLNVPSTWAVTKGKGKTAYVIDTGYTNHPDLRDAVSKEKSRSFLSDERAIDDMNGHSTHVCGIIGARDNDIGVVGVAPECSLVTGKVLGENGSGDFDAIRESLRYAKTLKPDVVNMSLGTNAYDEVTHNLIKDLYRMNIPVVAASGNDGEGNAVNYPGKYPEVICVTAFDKFGNPAKFNSTGPEANFSAPGVDIYSTWLNRKYIEISGTSMATPFVTGLVLLLLAKHEIQEAKTGMNDCKTVEQIRQHLIKYADDKGVVGKDDIWGYGVIDPNKMTADDSIDEQIPNLAPKEDSLPWYEKIINAFRLFWK